MSSHAQKCTQSQTMSTPNPEEVSLSSYFRNTKIEKFEFLETLIQKIRRNLQFKNNFGQLRNKKIRKNIPRINIFIICLLKAGL